MTVLNNIDPNSIAADYQRFAFDQLSDLELFRICAEGIAVPRVGVSGFNETSYALHAPLELLARYALLSHVPPTERTLVRQQMVALPVMLATLGTPVETPLKAIESVRPKEAWAHLEAALDSGHVEQADLYATHLARVIPPSKIVEQFGRIVVGRLGAAVHAPILLYLLHRSDQASARIARPFMRIYARALCEHSSDDFYLRAIDTTHADNADAEYGKFVQGMANEGPKAIGLLLRRTNPLSRPNAAGIAPMIQQARDRGLIQPVLMARQSLRTHDPGLLDEGFAHVTRIAASSMLHEGPERARYGWTHALSIPHALWEIAPALNEPGDALSFAYSVEVGFRSAIGKTTLPDHEQQLQVTALDFDAALKQTPDELARVAYHWPSSDQGRLRSRLAAIAGVRNDAHLAKYVLSCFQLAKLDPSCARLYYASAAYLAATWYKGESQAELARDLHIERF